MEKRGKREKNAFFLVFCAFFPYFYPILHGKLFSETVLARPRDVTKRTPRRRTSKVGGGLEPTGLRYSERRQGSAGKFMERTWRTPQ